MDKIKLERITDKQMAEVQGDKEVCLTIIKGFGTCKGCSACCDRIAEAQLQADLLSANKQLQEILKAKDEELDIKREEYARLEIATNLEIDGLKREVEQLKQDKKAMIEDAATKMNEACWADYFKKWSK